MKKLVGLLAGLILPIFLIPCFGETREQLGIPKKDSGVILLRGYDVEQKMFFENRDTNGDGICDLQESYTILDRGKFSIVFNKNSKIIWFDANKDGEPQRETEIFISPNQDENWMLYSRYLNEKYLNNY
jgi:hypothetical protein